MSEGLVGIRTLIPDILGAKGIVGCPPEIAEDAVRKTAIDFCTQTTIWEFQNEFKTQYNVADYPIYVPEGTRLASMKWIEVDGMRLNPSVSAGRSAFLGLRSRSPNSFFSGRGFSFAIDNRDTLWINPTPVDNTNCQWITYCAALKPTQTACELPEFLFEDWNDALTSGAAYRLFMLPKQDWSNSGLALQNQREYSRWIARARLTKMQNFTQSTVQMTGSYF